MLNRLLYQIKFIANRLRINALLKKMKTEQERLENEEIIVIHDYTVSRWGKHVAMLNPFANGLSSWTSAAGFGEGISVGHGLLLPRAGGGPHLLYRVYKIRYDKQITGMWIATMKYCPTIVREERGKLLRERKE